MKKGVNLLYFLCFIWVTYFGIVTSFNQEQCSYFDLRYPQPLWRCCVGTQAEQAQVSQLSAYKVTPSVVWIYSSRLLTEQVALLQWLPSSWQGNGVNYFLATFSSNLCVYISRLIVLHLHILCLGSPRGKKNSDNDSHLSLLYYSLYHAHRISLSEAKCIFPCVKERCRWQ